MQYMILGVLTFATMLLGIIYAVQLQRRERYIIDAAAERPQGHYLGMCISFGIVFGMICGTGIGNLYDQIAFGITFGTCLGIVTGLTFGNYLESRNVHKLRQMNEKEHLQHKNMMIFIYITAFVLLGVSLYLLFTGDILKWLFLALFVMIIIL